MSGSAAAATCLSVWHSVPERASYGTEYACRAQKGFLVYATRFLEALGAKNRLLVYRMEIRCSKRLPGVRDASSKARRTAGSTDCGQPTAAPDASSVRETAHARM